MIIGLGRFKPVFSHDQEIILYNYLKDMESRLVGLTMHDFRRLAFQLAEKNGLDFPFNTNTGMAGM